MIPRDHIAKICYAAAQAPSGDNAQPWRFEVHDHKLALFNVPGKDSSPYNFRERGSFLANGAAIENIVITASSFGYKVDIHLLPKSSDSNYVADIVLNDQKIAADPLASYIEKRTTNRKPYKKKPLVSDHKMELMNAIRQRNFGALLFLEDSNDIHRFAKLVSLSDQLIFEEKSIHDAIFGSIRWTKEEEEQNRGMYIKTLELPPPAQMLFKTLKNWSFLGVMNKVGISKFIASQSAKNFASSSAIGVLMMPDNSYESYINIGRTFERMWLTATKLGLYIQPLGALAYLAERVAAKNIGNISAEHAVAITKAQNSILGLFGNPDGVVGMMFRIGYSEPPTAHSKKSDPEIKYLA